MDRIYLVDYWSLKCDAVQNGRDLSTFRRNLLTPFNRKKGGEVCFSETSVNANQSARRHVSEGSKTLKSYCHDERFKSQNLFCFAICNSSI